MLTLMLTFYFCVLTHLFLYLLQFFVTSILTHLHLLLIADGMLRNTVAWFSSSHVCLISSIWDNMHLLHDCTIIFDTNDGLLLQISFQYLFIIYATKLFVPYTNSLKISVHNFNSAGSVLVLKLSILITL